MKILIVEDNEKLARSLKKGLEQEGFIADFLTDGEAGQKRIEETDMTYDALVLDIMLPKKNGLEVCRDLRSQYINIPILMLTAKDTLEDKVVGLNMGADDYLIKPFSIDELVARLHALLRRPQKINNEVFSIHNIELNPLTRRVMKGNKEIKLTQKEFSILMYLMKNMGKVLSRQEIIDHAWEYEFNTFSNLVDVKIKNIRKKIGDTGKIIETIRGTGYRFNE